MNEKYKLYCEGTRNGANLQEAFTSQRFPSVALRKNSFFSQALDDDQIGDDELLPLSMVCSGGESKSYSLYFFEGSESRWFFKEKKYVFEVLFNQMRPRAESHWSRLMNRVVLLHDNGPLFEMMDGRLYLFDIHTGLLSCFFIERSSQIRVIGSGLMSNIIMVQTTEGKIIKKHFNREPKEVVIDDPSPVKLFSCFCRDLQIIVLENNKFYIIKDGSSKESHYGFASYGFDVPVEVATPLFNSGIKKVSSGYRHCVVLLENGQVFTRGFNYHNQCANGDDTDIEGTFWEVKVTGVLDIECGSICTALRTKTHFIFYGSLIYGFDKAGYYHKVEYEDQQFSLGPWHALIFRNKFIKQVGKSEIYYINNLRSISLVNASPFSDTLFSFKDHFATASQSD